MGGFRGSILTAFRRIYGVGSGYGRSGQQEPAVGRMELLDRQDLPRNIRYLRPIPRHFRGSKCLESLVCNSWAQRSKYLKRLTFSYLHYRGSGGVHPLPLGGSSGGPGGSSGGCGQIGRSRRGPCRGKSAASCTGPGVPGGPGGPLDKGVPHVAAVPVLGDRRPWGSGGAVLEFIPRTVLEFRYLN